MNSIIQWNINGLQKHYKDIQRTEFSIQPIAFCFQETNLGPNNYSPIRGFNGYFKNRQTNLRCHIRYDPLRNHGNPYTINS